MDGDAVSGFLHFGYPDPFYPFNSGLSLHTAYATARSASVQEAPVTGSIEKVTLPLSVADGQSSVRVRFETEASTATAFTGVVAAPGAEAVLASATAGIHELTLGTPLPVVRGQKLIIVALYENYVSQVSFPRAGLLRNQYPGGFPYVAATTTGTGASRQNFCPGTALMIDGAWIPQREVMPILGTNTLSVGPALAATEGGGQITMPITAEVYGFWFSMPSIDGGYEVRLYDEADAVLASYTGKKEMSATGVGFYEFPTPVTVAAGSVVRLALKGLSGTNIVRYATTDTLARAALLPGSVLTQRSGSGAWVDDPLTCAGAGLLLRNVQAGGGSSPSNRKVKTGGVFVDI